MTLLHKKKINTLTIKLKYKYKNVCPDRSSKRSNILTIKEFVDELLDYDLFKKIVNINIDHLIGQIDICNKKFMKSLSYSEIIEDDKLLYTDESTLLEKHSNCIFMKNNNFRFYLVNYLQDNHIDPSHKFKTTREPVSAELREKVWHNEFKSKNTGICPVVYCQNELNKKKFICGHIVSVHNGGKTKQENLRPICGDCNTKMSATNWSEYENLLVYNKNNKKCYNCGKTTNKKTVHVYKKESVYKLYCKKCYDNLSECDSDIFND